MDAILLAAGMGKRMDIDCPKQFYKINGKPIFIYSLEALRKVKDIESIILVYRREHLDEYKKYVFDYGVEGVIYAEGGDTRQASMGNALDFVKTQFVLVHEAARPLISPEFVEHIMSFGYENIVPVIPVNFTVATGGERMKKLLKRDTLKNIQLPQVFHTTSIRLAHTLAHRDKHKATDDSTLLFHYGYPIRFVQGRESNIKITTNLDLLIAENLLKANE